MLMIFCTWGLLSALLPQSPCVIPCMYERVQTFAQQPSVVPYADELCFPVATVLGKGREVGLFYRFRE